MGSRFKALNPFGPRINEMFRSYLKDVVDVIGDKAICCEEEFIQEMKSHNPDFIIGGFGMPYVTEKIIRAGNKLRAVVCVSVGVEYIDLDAATKNKVFVTNSPTAAVPVAEYALGLMLAVIRRIVSASSAAASGGWTKREEFEGMELEGKTLGIVGIGRVGRCLASKAKGLGMKVMAYDPYVSADMSREFDIPLVDDLETLLRNSDVVSIHVPQTDSTTNMIGEKQLRVMKKSAFLINCARGSVVDEEALLKALKEKWIVAAGLDVLREEPPRLDNPFLHLENAVVTPHIAWNTKEAKENRLKTVRDEILRIIQGEIPRNLVNKEVLQRLTNV